MTDELTLIEQYQAGQRNFNHCTSGMLRGESLSGAALQEIQFNGAALEGVDFSNCDLTAASMRGSFAQWQQLGCNWVAKGKFQRCLFAGCQPEQQQSTTVLLDWCGPNGLKFIGCRFDLCQFDWGLHAGCQFDRSLLI